MLDKHKCIIALDYDKVLAYVSEDGKNDITNQDIIPKMKECILNRLKLGDKVVLFTARAYNEGEIAKLRKWLDNNGLQDIKKITNIKLPEFTEFWDDKAVHIDPNLGTGEHRSYRIHQLFEKQIL